MPEPIDYESLSNSPEPFDLQDAAATDLEIDSTPTDAVTVTVEKLAGRQRQLEAQIQLLHPLDRVWTVLTDYEALADFIPNLSHSRRLAHPEDGIRLEQVGQESALFLNFSARVVLDLTEVYPQAIHFQMVEGDFRSFNGSWLLSTQDHLQPLTHLTYRLLIVPKLAMPVAAIEKRLRRNLAANLLAIRERLDTGLSS